MPLRFDADYNDPDIAWDPLVDEVFGELTSSFLEMPKGEGFIDYPTFEKGYQALKRHTNAFAATTPDKVLAAVHEVPIVFVVSRYGAKTCGVCCRRLMAKSSPLLRCTC